MKRKQKIYTAPFQKNSFPSSSSSIRQNYINNGLELTPQEGEQLSKYVSDDIYVKKQKEDIEELASFFKDIMKKQSSSEDPLISAFKAAYNAQPGFTCTYAFTIDEKSEPLVVDVNGMKLSVSYDKTVDADISLRLSSEAMRNITSGRSTFQKAFMTGEMTSKGNFNTLRMLDQLFNFT